MANTASSCVCLELTQPQTGSGRSTSNVKKVEHVYLPEVQVTVTGLVEVKKKSTWRRWFGKDSCVTGILLLVIGYIVLWYVGKVFMSENTPITAPFWNSNHAMGFIWELFFAACVRLFYNGCRKYICLVGDLDDDL